jgi:hypothetical protein
MWFISNFIIEVQALQVRPSVHGRWKGTIGASPSKRNSQQQADQA